MSVSQHHLIIGGAGAIGVSYASVLKKAEQDVSIYVRESHRNQFEKNEKGMMRFEFDVIVGRYQLTLGLEPTFRFITLDSSILFIFFHLQVKNV